MMILYNLSFDTWTAVFSNYIQTIYSKISLSQVQNTNKTIHLKSSKWFAINVQDSFYSICAYNFRENVGNYYGQTWLLEDFRLSISIFLSRYQGSRKSVNSKNTCLQTQGSLYWVWISFTLFETSNPNSRKNSMYLNLYSFFQSNGQVRSGNLTFLYA